MNRERFLMIPDEILLETEAAMEKGVEYMQHEFASVRTGKASPALVENIEVDAYGTSMRLKQLALISTPEPRLLLIQPFDASVTKDIERALKESKIGITPAVDGKLIRLPIPELSEERRKDLVKTVRHMAEEARVRLRSSRRGGSDLQIRFVFSLSCRPPAGARVSLEWCERKSTQAARGARASCGADFRGESQPKNVCKAD